MATYRLYSPFIPRISANEQFGPEWRIKRDMVSLTLTVPSANKLAGWNNERVKAEMSLPQCESHVFIQFREKLYFKEVCILMITS